MTRFVGTSGWQYQSWKQPFYEGAPQRTWLERYSHAFPTVEVNNAFYRLPTSTTFADWHDRTPDDFMFAVKMSRYLTHVKRLHNPQEPVSRFLRHAEPLGTKLGPVLLQLPPTLRADNDLLEATLGAFPSEVRVSVEFRHDSWFNDDVRKILERNEVALCLADRRGVLTPLWRTAGWGYVRLHEGTANPGPCYGRTALQSWSERISDLWPQDQGDVFVYFNNDPNACAVRNARTFTHMSQ